MEMKVGCREGYFYGTSPKKNSLGGYYSSVDIAHDDCGGEDDDDNEDDDNTHNHTNVFK
jgi:hypothetical protein